MISSSAGCCRFECNAGTWGCIEKCPCKTLGGQGQGFCPKDGDDCDCEGSFTDTTCCSIRPFSTFTCRNGKWTCSDSCTYCNNWGGEGLGFCPKDFTSCNCQGSFTDTTCCDVNNMSDFTCNNGQWICSNANCPPDCDTIGGPGKGLCPKDGSACDCKGSFTDKDCCSENGMSDFTCNNGAWTCSSKNCPPDCITVGGQGEGFCPKDGSACDCEGSFSDTSCCSENGMSDFTCSNGRWTCSSRNCVPTCASLFGTRRIFCPQVGTKCNCTGYAKVTKCDGGRTCSYYCRGGVWAKFCSDASPVLSERVGVKG